MKRTNLIISEADARDLKDEDASSQILRKCRVIVVISGYAGGIEGVLPAHLAFCFLQETSLGGISAPARGSFASIRQRAIAIQRAYSRKKNRLVTSLFGEYVSEGVVSDILKGNIGVNFEGRARQVTVLFSDLRGFTTISEGLTPQETGRLLNSYFDAMIPIVFAHQGTLDTGTVTVGNLGSRFFMDYTVIGDAVNLGSRLEGLNKV